ncbi:MAG: hypothetical protein JSS73_12025 [Bacteroidetes bacterium]|nr:hypothetical protein [Bacteroidota bacterium]
MEQRVENLLRILTKAYADRRKSLSSIDRFRFLVAMETYLIVLEYIPAGQLGIPYGKIQRKFLGIIPYTSEESYEEYILRLTRDYISK